MIGNDIVDLAFAKKESNWKRPRYLDKIFTSDEQLLIATAINPDLMVWNLWSRKEAAYKIYNRVTGIRGYFPLQLICVFENANNGVVLCNGHTFYTKTKIVNNKIHTVAVREKADFERVIEIGSEINIVKIKGIPFIKEESTNALIPVSLSHHGCFSALITLKS